MFCKQYGPRGFLVLGKSIQTDRHRQNQLFEIIVSFFFLPPTADRGPRRPTMTISGSPMPAQTIAKMASIDWI